MKGVTAEKLNEVTQSQDGKITRILFQQPQGVFYFEFPTNELAGLLPILNKAALAPQTGYEKIVIQVSEVQAGLSIEGDLLLTLTNTAGAQMTFGLSPSLTAELGDLVDEALAPQPGASH